MRSRGLVVALAVLLAVAAAGAVVLYTNGVKKAAESGGSLTTVIVATQDIPANTSLNALVDAGGFKELSRARGRRRRRRGHEPRRAPRSDDHGARSWRTSSSRHRTCRAASRSPAACSASPRVTSRATIKLTAPQGVNGNIQRGDNITVFATFTGASIIKGSSVEELVNGTASDDRPAGAPGLHRDADPDGPRAAGREPRASTRTGTRPGNPSR